MIFDSFLKEVDRGREGYNKGLANGFDRLNDYIFGVQRGCYYTIGGETGSGKSSLAMQMFVYAPFYDALAKNATSKLKILYLSFELPKEEIIAKLTSRYLFDKYGLVVDTNTLFSKGDRVLTNDVRAILEKARPFFEALEESLFIIDNPLSVSAIYAKLKGFAEYYGKFVKEEIRKSDGYSSMEEVYYPNDDQQFLFVILDHAGKIPGNNKESIDMVSTYFVQFRNKCQMSYCMVNQLNRATTDSLRLKMGHVDPKLSDWKDTNNVLEDCNVALSLFNAKRAQLKSHRGYNIEALDSRYRNLAILKNRYGEDQKYLGLGYYGEVCLFEELPPASSMQSRQYEKAINRLKDTSIKFS